MTEDPSDLLETLDCGIYLGGFYGNALRPDMTIDLLLYHAAASPEKNPYLHRDRHVQEDIGMPGIRTFAELMDAARSAREGLSETGDVHSYIQSMEIGQRLCLYGLSGDDLIGLANLCNQGYEQGRSAEIDLQVYFEDMRVYPYDLTLTHNTITQGKAPGADNIVLYGYRHQLGTTFYFLDGEVQPFLDEDMGLDGNGYCVVITKGANGKTDSPVYGDIAMHVHPPDEYWSYSPSDTDLLLATGRYMAFYRARESGIESIDPPKKGLSWADGKKAILRL
ncbi:MAG: hypothetical protein ABH879_10200 [archaeon]